MLYKLASALLLVSFTAIPVVAQDAAGSDNPLTVLSGFIGTWKADVTKDGSTDQVNDISQWSWTLDKKAIRIEHMLDNGSYAGESLLTWDHRANTIAYLYATSAGFFTRGSMRADSTYYDTMETVTGDAGGVVGVRSTGELLEDGSLRVISEMRSRKGWAAPDTSVYVRVPDTMSAR